ncbi:MAG: UDP-N-acetylmuramoyl-tripeptide--D-alanyl-D-alanine ligase [Oscillospiraceae bacterium]|nr:UDP-N-acetylmuramoyl-tripeptide--D-alanyl-D-alanine ligase [Oscillospiraceae bacterium]
MREVKISDIARKLGCEIGYDAVIKNVTTDSREVNDGDLFVAIKGENFDGNKFAKSALEKGACAVCVSELCEGVDPAKALIVDDTKRALIKIGGVYREGFSIPFVGITGSVGKTTTKEFIATVLGEKYKVHKTEGNRNNEICVPMTLMALEDSAEIGVIEMGMCGFGEIHDLTTEVKPAVGVITSIGVSHIELLGSRENILKAKLELLDGMKEGSPLFLCGDNDLLCTVNDERYKIYRYGITNSECDILARDIVQVGSSMKFVIDSPWGEYTATIPLVGMHNVLDALAAFGVGCVMGVEPKIAAKALEKIRSCGISSEDNPP